MNNIDKGAVQRDTRPGWGSAPTLLAATHSKASETGYPTHDRSLILVPGSAESTLTIVTSSKRTPTFLSQNITEGI